jgi:hypothetical protein
MFVSGHFTGNFSSQLARISRSKNVMGAAVSAANLLLCVEAIKEGLTLQAMAEGMFNNEEHVV